MVTALNTTTWGGAKGSKGCVSLLRRQGKRIDDERKLARIEALAIPPAWKEVFLPALREATSLQFGQEEFDRERVSAIALRLIELGWFRVGSERYIRDGTYGVMTLSRHHVAVVAAESMGSVRSCGVLQSGSEIPLP